MGMASISSAVGRRSGLGCNKHATMARKSSEYVLSIGLCSTHYTPVRTSDMKGYIYACILASGPPSPSPSLPRACPHDLHDDAGDVGRIEGLTKSAHFVQYAA